MMTLGELNKHMQWGVESPTHFKKNPLLLFFFSSWCILGEDTPKSKKKKKNQKSEGKFHYEKKIEIFFFLLKMVKELVKNDF